MPPIRLLLADDHQLVRAGLRALLERMPGMQVVAEATDGREALRMMQTHQPHVALMDVMMPELNGLEATARAAHRFPQTRVIMLSMYAAPELVLQALRAGAAGYLVKSVSPQELELAINAAARGETYLSSAISRHVVDACLQSNRDTANSLERLTHRQREVLQLIAEGNTTKQIARKLGVAPKTVETYRAELMKELDIHDIAGLTRCAIRLGLVTADA